MRVLTILLFTVSCLAQNQAEATSKDSLGIIGKNPKKGFFHEYILFVPKGTPKNKQITLLVEPNNTGAISDDTEVHKKAAIALASKSSVGNNVATEAKIPLLVPIFPRSETDSLTYTHALDRDVMLKTGDLKRLDLQLLCMISDARQILSKMNIEVENKFFMSGFSASATFVNRFSFLHPKDIKALAIGGFNGELLLPLQKINGIKLNYPIGTNDFKQLFGKNPDIETLKTVPQLVYMGKLDDNDAVQYDDAYDEKERKIINQNIGDNVQERFLECQKIYNQNGIFPSFRSYENVGHWTTPQMNAEVIRFFCAQLSAAKSAP